MQALERALRGEVSEWATATRTSSLLKAVAHWTEDTTNNDVSGVGFYMERARTCVRLAEEFKEFADKLAAAVGEILSNPLSVILLLCSSRCPAIIIWAQMFSRGRREGVDVARERGHAWTD